MPTPPLPSLPQQPLREPFAAPEGYFAQLPTRVLARVRRPAPHPLVYRLHQALQGLQLRPEPALAALLLLLLAFAGGWRARSLPLERIAYAHASATLYARPQPIRPLPAAPALSERLQAWAQQLPPAKDWAEPMLSSLAEDPQLADEDVWLLAAAPLPPAGWSPEEQTQIETYLLETTPEDQLTDWL